MILKLGMEHRKLKLYKGYINDEPGLTSSYFTARTNWVADMFEWGKLLHGQLVNGENLQQRTKFAE